MKPNLFIPGVAKSGTSSLHQYLDLHPNIEMSRIKEPQYFSSNESYSKGLGFYKNLFNNKTVNYWGESSTAYFGDQIAQERIKKDLGDVKFIVILRDPIKRTISHYLWQVSLLQEFRSFRKAVEYNMYNPVDHRNPGLGGHIKSYYGASLYGEKLERLINNFGKENIHVITAKELKTDTNTTLNSCFDFLGLKPINISLLISSNKTKNIPNIKDRLLSFLAKAVKRGVVDFRLLYLGINYKVGKVYESDKVWLGEMLKKDQDLLLDLYPGIDKRW